MGADDDADCPGHVWVLDEVAVNETGRMDRVERCTTCTGVRYRPAPERRNRPPL